MLFVIHALWKCNLLSKNKNNNYVVICVNKKYRGKQLAEKIIQTHEYTQRFLNKNISVRLFKR